MTTARFGMFRVVVLRATLALMPSLIAISSLAAQQLSPDEQLARSIAIYRAGDILGAIRATDSLIAKHPSDFRGYLNKAIFTRQLALGTARPALLDSAVALLREARVRAPTDVDRALVIGNMGTTHIERGDFGAAAESFQESYALSGRLFYRLRAAYALARQGYFVPAINRIAQLSIDDLRDSDSPGNEGLSAYNMGLIYALAGRSSDSVKWLELAATVAPGRYSDGFRRDADLDRIRTTQDFRSFLLRHGAIRR